MWIRFAIDNGFTLLDPLTFEHDHVTPLGYQLLVGFTVIHGDYQALLTLGVFAEADNTRDLRQDRRFFRLARFKQIGDPGQTTGDVAGLGRLLRDTCHYVTDIHVLPILHLHNGTRLQEVMSGDLGSGQEQLLTLTVGQADHWPHFLACAAALLRIGHNQAGQSGDFIKMLIDGYTIDKLVEHHSAGNFRHDRMRVRIPGSGYIAGGDSFLVTHGYDRTIGNLVSFALTAVIVDHRQLTGA